MLSHLVTRSSVTDVAKEPAMPDSTRPEPAYGPLHAPSDYAGGQGGPWERDRAGGHGLCDRVVRGLVIG